uniref:SET domain and mariner transposase fusion putative n=1 Tax=Albugo laibachii Nc14 TaxID=890382 RepID=F0WAE2_9STRA|nr:SET domain and mariner transposase fusion putative [Albugo laibachii Nc14]|eukprot:CCA18113.1 SET domain and mariner transposase fusion putative [Albugo laibachii Nc14]
MPDYMNALHFLITEQRVCHFIGIGALKNLLLVSRSTSQLVKEWMQRLESDLSDGAEAFKIPCVGNISKSQFIELMRFTYVTKSVIPIQFEKHGLPLSLRTRQEERYSHLELGTKVPVYLQYTPGKGWGVFAGEEISFRTCVGEYVGEVLSTVEVQHRYREKYDRSAQNYVLVVRESLVEIQTSGPQILRTNVDATYFGNFTRFINHGCDPLLSIELFRIDSFIPRLLFYTTRNVKKGEELIFDYGLTPHIPNTKYVYRQCLCGSEHCRKKLPFDASA